MVMIVVLALVTLLCLYGLKQTKQQGNVFGFAVSAISTLAFGFTTVLAIIL